MTMDKRICLLVFASMQTLSYSFTHDPYYDYHVLPTHDEQALVDNMTGWILDSTTKLYLKAHLLLCPRQDMCFGDRFKRNYTSQLPFLSCGHCDCGSHCHRKQNCCPWRSYTQDRETSPEYISYKNRDLSQDIRKDNLSNVQLQCITPQVNGNAPFHLRSEDSYLFVAQCLHNDDMETKRRCENNTDFQDIFLYQPVFSLASNETFKNKDCAICNGETVENLVYWIPIFICSSKRTFYQTYTYSWIQSLVHGENSLCNLAFLPLDTRKVTKCYKEENYVSTCNIDNQLTSVDPIIFEACVSDYVNYYLHCLSPFQTTLYKNIFCAMCNSEYWESKLTIECISANIQKKKNWPFVAFSAVIGFEENGERIQLKKDTKCQHNAFYEKELNKCIPISCEDGMVYSDFKCKPLYSFILQNNYEINLLFQPILNISHSRREISIGINLFLIKFAKDNNFYDSICFFTIYSYPRTTLWTPKNFYFVAIIKLSIDYWHNSKDLIQRLNTAIASLDNAALPGFIVRHVGQSFRTRYILGANLIKGVQNPMNDDVLEQHSEFVGKRSYKDHACYDSVALELVSVVAEWSICPKLIFDTRDVHIYVTNFSLCFSNFQFCINSLYFRYSHDKSKVEVCFEQYLAKMSRISFRNSTSEGFNFYTSVVCTTLSSIGCITSLVSNLIIHKKEIILKKNMIIVSSVLILANTAYILSQTCRNVVCHILESCSQFSWLTLVIFMLKSCLSICCFGKKKSDDHPSKHVCLNFILSLVLSGLLVFITELLGHKLHLGSYGDSYISRYSTNLPTLTLYTFTVPVVLSSILSLFVFFFILRKPQKLSYYSSFDLQIVTTFCKMSVTAAYTWLFHYLFQIYQLQVFYTLHFFFMAIMGLVMSFAFGLSSKRNHCNPEQGKLENKKV